VQHAPEVLSTYGQGGQERAFLQIPVLMYVLTCSQELLKYGHVDYIFSFEMGMG
jgi:hypothetical protein